GRGWGEWDAQGAGAQEAPERTAPYALSDRHFGWGGPLPEPFRRWRRFGWHRPACPNRPKKTPYAAAPAAMSASAPGLVRASRRAGYPPRLVADLPGHSWPVLHLDDKDSRGPPDEAGLQWQMDRTQPGSGWDGRPRQLMRGISAPISGQKWARITDTPH